MSPPGRLKSEAWIAAPPQGLQGLHAPAQGLHAPAQGLQGLQGLQAAQGLQGLHAAHGLHGLQAAQGLHAAAQGLQGLSAAQGLHGFSSSSSSTPHGLQGLQAPAQGLQGLHAAHGLHGLQLAARSRSSPEDVAEAPTRTAHGFEEAECTVAPPPMAMRPPITAPYKGLRLNLGCCWSFIAHGLLCPPECLPVGLLFRLVLYFTKSCAAIRQQVSILVEFTEQGAYPYIQTIPGLSKLSPIAFRA